MWKPPEPDSTAAEDAASVVAAQAEATRRVVIAVHMAMHRGKSTVEDRTKIRELRRAEPGRMTDEQLLALDRLAWKFRRALSAGLAPRMNPDDPIVRAQREGERSAAA